jgi:hypothetical protein
MLDKKGPFSLATGERDGLPYFLGVRKEFHKFQGKESYSWLLTIEVDAEDKSQVGLVSDDEAEVLNNLEDFLERKLESVAGIYFVARITWNGIRSIFYYVSDPKPIAEELNKLIEQGQYPREFEYKIEKDAEWKKMSDIIPNIEEI